MDAPTCPLCGKKEWRHVCAPKGEIRPRPIVPITAPLPKPKLEANVKDFGAVGDGITDDRKALRRVGRPKLIKDFKAHRKAYMRAYRARKSGSLG